MRSRRALLSVFDKTGLVEFARGLFSLGFRLVSTGGSARALREAGVEVEDVSAATGFPEILDGRLKTLHPKVFGGILARRGREDDMAVIERFGIEPFDLVSVDLYPFERAPSLDEIDIGGAALLRAAAKSWPDVIPVPGPAHYSEVLAELRETGDVSEKTRRRLAAETFLRISRYDREIAGWLGARRPLRYGENPHQQGWLEGEGPGRLLSGKDLSYTNLLDLDAAISLVEDLPGECAAAIVKHATPCGAAAGATPAAAFSFAHEADALSAYGGIVAVRPALDRATACAMTEASNFFECAIAPRVDRDALEVLLTRPKWGRSVRVLEAGPRGPGLESRTIRGGSVLQERDAVRPEDERFSVRSRRAPNAEEEAALRFAIACVKHARSNAIAIAAPTRLFGIGAGQTSRVGAVKIALEKAGERARGAVLASDAFFPFPDSIELAAKAGIAAIAEPGGAKRDEDVIRACDAAGIALVFTGVRHFRH
jgi:phosphoribosylaminoimidazolecarboxamide formyltransferase/IMP cyclohydrolase